MATNNIYAFSSLTGGTDDSYLDYHDGDDLSDGDFAFGIVSGVHYAYKLDATSGAAENSPYVISPDTNPGTKRWILQTPGGAFSHVDAHRATAQSIPNTTVTTIIYNTENTDALTEYNASTGVFTATYAGYYKINAVILFTSATWAANESAVLIIYKNSALHRRGLLNVTAGVTSPFGASVSATVSLAANDTIDIRGYHDQGGALNLIAGDGSHNWLTIDRIA